MSADDVLFAISEAGLMLKASRTEDTLKVYPAEKLTPKVAASLGSRPMPTLVSVAFPPS